MGAPGLKGSGNGTLAGVEGAAVREERQARRGYAELMVQKGLFAQFADKRYRSAKYWGADVTCLVHLNAVRGATRKS